MALAMGLLVVKLLEAPGGADLYRCIGTAMLDGTIAPDSHGTK